MTDPDIEQRIRALIERLENWQPDREYAELAAAARNDEQAAEIASRDHWFNCGMDEAYDNVIDWLYSDVLREER